MVVPHIVSLASGAGLVDDGNGAADVAWRRTFGEWIRIVIKNDVFCRNMFVNNKLGGVGGGAGLVILFTARFAKVYRSLQLGGNICHNNHNPY